MFDVKLITPSIMQDIKTSPASNSTTNNSLSTSQMNFYHKNNLSDDFIIGRVSNIEDDSRVELNNCRKIIEKPPMVKRFTMGILRPSTEDSHPLMRNPSLTTSLSQSTSDGYVNEGVCDSEKAIANSCRQVLFATTDDVRYLNKQSETSHSNHSRPSAVKSNKKPMLSASKVLQSDVMTLAEQNELKGAAWFQAGIPREICLEVLSRQHPGAFLVRKSSSKAGCFALSLRTPPPGPKVVHYLVLRTAKGYKIKGFTKEFSSLLTLITHHSVMPELLPVPLALPRAPTNAPHNMADVNDTYGSLNDFQKMMTDLNL